MLGAGGGQILPGTGFYKDDMSPFLLRYLKNSVGIPNAFLKYVSPPPGHFHRFPHVREVGGKVVGSLPHSKEGNLFKLYQELLVLQLS
jgi:hypothetical protein